MNKRLIILTGPTAIGKTSKTIQLAQALGTEILSCDSRQMYREIRIGTARPTDEELSAAKHHFIANLSIHDYYNAARYEQDALNLLSTLFQSYDTVLLTGGTGLYIDTLCNGIDDLPEIDMSVRQQVKQNYTEQGITYLQQTLQQLDPDYYQKVDIHNPQRMTKAIEVCLQTNKPYSSFLTAVKRPRPFIIQKYLLSMPRDILYKRIELRVHQMIDEGLLKEAEAMYPYRHLNALNTVGYKELFAYFDGTLSLQEAIDKIIINTRHYAKRQLTWFNRNKDYTLIPTDKDITELIK